MRRNDPSIEAFLFIGSLILIVISVFIIGLLVVKVYRKFKPFKVTESHSLSISISDKLESDGFFKIFFIGIIVSSPVLYFLYISM